MMKKAIQVQEVEGEGLLALLGQRVTLFCMNYFYTGDLIGVNDDCVLLKNPQIVYETGGYTTKSWANAEPLPHDLRSRSRLRLGSRSGLGS